MHHSTPMPSSHPPLTAQVTDTKTTNKIVAFVGFFWKLGLGSWESGPGSCLFAGAEDAQRLHAHLMIREGTGRLNLPTDIRGQTIRGSPVNEFDGR